MIAKLLPIGPRFYWLMATSVAFVVCLAFTHTRLSSAQKSDGQSIVLAGTIGGKVFQDFNGNGTFDTSVTIPNNGFGTVGVAIDRGVQGVEARAYNAAGLNVTTGGVVTTDAAGNFTITTNDLGTGPYRVEFTALPVGYFPSARSTDSINGGTATNSGSATQFVSTPATNVNLAINYPTDYSQNNPEVVAAMYTPGDPILGPLSGNPEIISFPYSAGSSDSAAGATESLYDAPTINPLDVAANQIGATFGLAYARKNRLIYASAFFKRHAGFGPHGPNAIYVIDRTGSGSVVNFFTVPGAATNSHDATNYPRDNNNTGWNAVGTTSLGGLAISEDESTLYVMNLENRTLYSMNATTGAVIASQAAPTNLPLPSGTCASADARPFAVTMYHGQLYVGMVCSAQSTANVDNFTDSNANGIWDGGDYFIDANGNGVRDVGESYFELTGNGVYNAGEAFTDTDGNGVYNLGDARGLRAYVYTVNPSTLAFGASPDFQMPLNYRRGLATHTQSALGAWRPWSNVYRNASTGNNRTVYAQPMLTDIAFDNGNMILAFRDRVGDQVGNGTLSNPNDATTTTLYQPRTAGDVIRACGSPNSWIVENNGRCSGNGTAPQNVAEGPGGGEFYYGDAYDLSSDFISPAVTISGKGGNHDDTASGGVEQLPGAPDVLISNFDPIANIANMTHDGGIRWLSNTTGNFTKGYRIYDGLGDDTDVFGKAGGVGGSLVLLSDPAPIELGNRVWRDSNGDGVQDPGENGISGVTVHLYNASNSLIATAVTDANGEYYFISGMAPDPNTADNIGIVNGQILFSTSYQIRFDLAANYSSGGPLFGLFLTIPNQTSQQGDDDSSDSDAINVLNPVGSPAGRFPVISANTGGPGANNHTLDVGYSLTPSAAGVSIDGRIMTTDGTGIRNVIVTLVEQDGTIHMTRTGSFGYYNFEDVAAGQSVIVSIYSRRFSFPQPVRVVMLKDAVSDLDFVANE